MQYQHHHENLFRIQLIYNRKGLFYKVWLSEHVWAPGVCPFAGCSGLWEGMAAATCTGPTVACFVWRDVPSVNKVRNVGSQGRFSFVISFGLSSL